MTASTTRSAKPIPGLHHVTAIAGDPQRNLDFYTRVLGLRFVKKTVNFDDPGTYHFYFGDDAGTPGTILTFFPWPHATPGTPGSGEVLSTAFEVPATAIDYWQQRLAAHGVIVETPFARFGAPVLSFRDPDGMQIELIGSEETHALKAPRFADVPAEHAVRGFHSVTLLERELRSTAAALDLLGYREIASDGPRIRFTTAADGLGQFLDVLVDPTARPGRLGAGSVHHIAFRSEDYDDQKAWLARISTELSVSPVMDRDYFRSIYFREPGGVLFELATDIPGFATDEPAETLGERLSLPEWLEPHRAKVEQRLPVVTLTKPVEESRA